MNPMVLALLIMGVTILCFIFEPLPLVVSALQHLWSMPSQV